MAGRIGQHALRCLDEHPGTGMRVQQNVGLVGNTLSDAREHEEQAG